MFAGVVDMPPGSQEWTDKRFWYKSEWWKEISTENGSIKIRKKSIKNSELYFSFAHIMYGSTVTQLISFLVRIKLPHTASLILLVQLRYI